MFGDVQVDYGLYHDIGPWYGGAWEAHLGQFEPKVTRTGFKSAPHAFLPLQQVVPSRKHLYEKEGTVTASVVPREDGNMLFTLREMEFWCANVVKAMVNMDHEFQVDLPVVQTTGKEYTWIFICLNVDVNIHVNKSMHPIETVLKYGCFFLISAKNLIGTILTPVKPV